jgi:hypothetical protein
VAVMPEPRPQPDSSVSRRLLRSREDCVASVRADERTYCTINKRPFDHGKLIASSLEVCQARDNSLEMPSRSGWQRTWTRKRFTCRLPATSGQLRGIP